MTPDKPSPSLHNLKPGDHLCCIYRTEEEHRAVITPFLRQGLEQSHKIIYIADTHSTEHILDCLRKDGLDVDLYLDSGQLNIVESRDTYLRDGVFNPATMIDLLRAEEEKCLAEGYKALRVTGEMTWALGAHPGAERLIEYEAKLNDFFTNSRCLAICQYDRRRFGADLLLGVLTTHPLAIIGEKIYDNFYYLPPEEFLGPVPEEARLNRLLSNLDENDRIVEARGETEERYRALFDRSLDMIYLIDFEGNFVDANPAALDLLGYEKEEITYTNMASILSPDQLGTAFESMEKLKKIGNQPQTIGIKVKKKNGEELYLETRGSLIYRDGVPYGIMGIGRDLTMMKQAEDDLRRERDLVSQIMQTSPAGIMVMDDEGRVIFANDQAEQILGVSIDEITQRTYDAPNWLCTDLDGCLIPDDQMPFRQAMDTGQAMRDVRQLMQRPDGQKIVLSINASPIFDQDGRVDGVVDTLEDITERLAAEKTLRASEKKFKSLINSSLDGVIVLDKNGLVLYVNPAAEELFGRPAEQFLGKAFGFHTADGERTDIQIIKKNREIAFAEMRVVKTKWEDQTAYLASLRDITDRKRAEEALRRELEINTALAGTAAGLVSAAPLEEISSLVLKQALKLTDSTYGFAGYIDPETGNLICPTMTRDIWETCQVEGKDIVFKKFTGLWGWVLNNHAPLLTNNTEDDPRSSETPAGHLPIRRFLGVPAMIGDNLVGMLGLANAGRDYTEHDLTAIKPLAALYAMAVERKRREDEILENERRLRSILDSIAAGLLIIDPENHRIVDVNLAGVKLIGGTKERIVGAECFEFFDIGGRGNCPITDLDEKADNSERVLVTVNGQKVPTIKAAAHIRISGRDYLLETFIDNTERKRAEERLQEQFHLLQAVIENTPSAIFIKDIQGRYLNCNQPFAELLGTTRDQLVGKTLHDLMPKELADRILERDEALLRNPGQQIYEMESPRADGNLRNILFQRGTFTNAEGELVGIVGVLTDMTETKLMERRLSQAQKLEAIGQLAAGVAHEINTPTQYIHGNVEFLAATVKEMLRIIRECRRCMSQIESGVDLGRTLEGLARSLEGLDLDFLAKEVPEAVNGCLEGVDRITKIVESMRYFAHPGRAEKLPLDVNQAVQNAITVSRNAWKYHAEVKTDLDPDLPLWRGYGAEFNQVLLNILINAAHAVSEVVGKGKDKGLITVSTAYNDGWIEIRISDTGPGIPTEIRSRIFDPFFTTKGVGKGTGQGLAIAHSVIVEKHGGAIDFDTRMGQGTTFIIRVPIEN